MSLRAQFVLAWAIGIAGVVGAAQVDDAFLALGLVTGLMLLSIGAKLLVARTPRIVVGGLLFMAGSGWMFGGILGVLALLGVAERESAA